MASDANRSARARTQLLDVMATRPSPNPGSPAWQLGHLQEALRPEFDDAEVAIALSQLFVAGLVVWDGYQGTSQRFTYAGPERQAEPSDLPDEIIAVWEEASACLPSRPRAGAILLGVAAEMALGCLADFLRTKAPHKDLHAMQLSTRRAKCIEILRQNGSTLFGLTDDQIRSAVTALEAMEVMAWMRDEAAHRDPARVPDIEALISTACSFPSLGRAVLRLIP